MKNKIIIIIFIIIFLIALGFLLINKTQNIQVETQIEEVVPGEEISDEQLRTTIITLYFKDKNTNELIPEARSIDVKEIMEEPYSKIINMLIEGPINSNSENVIPVNTKLINVYLEGNILIINFSKDFLEIENMDKEAQEITLKSIKNTLIELKEVNNIRILIEGESNIVLKNTDINLYNYLDESSL